MRSEADGMTEAAALQVPLGADPRVLKVLGHPVRLTIFSRLGERPWSAVELHEDLDIPYEAVREHIRVLKAVGAAEQIGYESSPRRGRRTLYRAVRFYFTAEQWAALPEAVRESGSSTFVELLTKDAIDALRSGTMEARDDRVLVRRPLWTDHEGAKEVEEIQVRADREIAEVERRSTERRNGSSEKPVRLITAQLSFPASESSGENSH
jgi:DNA-binding transcriptional ArsR family regulator